jgi:hypothetical protein
MMVRLTCESLNLEFQLRKLIMGRRKMKKKAKQANEQQAESGRQSDKRQHRFSQASRVVSRTPIGIS